jgi:hypothetical protein
MADPTRLDPTRLRVLRARNLYPPIDPPAFHINGRPQHGGLILPGARLTLVNPNAGEVIFYTLDGGDPANARSSLVYTGPIPLTQTTRIKARLLDQGQWSALNEATYEVAAKN